MSSSSSFQEIQHIVKCQHTREYIAATRNGDEDTPSLSVKQYIPLGNLKARPGDVTIIGAHANGFPKELYEPLWAEMVTRLASKNVNVRSIWIADTWNQGQSGVLNETMLGNDPKWFDHSRDLLNLINQKQEDMPHPLIGIGHSMGATQLSYLSLIHPRLLHSLVLLDPVIQPTNAGITPAVRSTPRRDTWQSLEAAVASFRRSPFYQAWDTRVFDLWVKHGLRPTPTELHTKDPVSTTQPVTLTTSKHQELFSYLRPTYRGVPGETYSDNPPLADLTSDQEYPFYRPEPTYIFNHLPELLPSVLYVYGDKSEFSSPELREAQLASTGTGLGGSGGVAKGKVHNAVLDCGHMIPMERAADCADVVSDFLARELHRWKQQQKAFQEFQEGKSRREQIMIDERWLGEVNPEKGGIERKVGMTSSMGSKI